MKNAVLLLLNGFCLGMLALSVRTSIDLLWVAAVIINFTAAILNLRVLQQGMKPSCDEQKGTK